MRYPRAELFFKDEDEILKMLDNIDKYAGSFVKALGEAFRRADNINRIRLLEAFPEYFEQYRDWGKK